MKGRRGACSLLPPSPACLYKSINVVAPLSFTVFDIVSSAARKGKVKAMELLIVNNAEIDATNEENWTPLFHAVSKLQYEAAELLLRNGAQCSRVDSKLCSCLHYAAREGCCKLTSLLLQYGGECLLFQRNSENRLVLHEAVIAGNERVSLAFISRINQLVRSSFRTYQQ